MEDLAIARTKNSFSKIEATCRTALDQGIHYVWVDTCCIDKSSSAELSEALNSMFRWYKNAIYCFAFLSDLPAGSQFRACDDVRKCRWFTRGWTLQELIAPTTVIFYDANWNFLGTKQELAQEIQAITDVDEGVLKGGMPLTAIPLAKRMSWAAKRKTTRVEDLAYCLLGIFDVNMPMLYGEGVRAFVRLQEEILKKTTDLSLLAWRAKKDSEYRGILAETPTEYLGCSMVHLNDDQFSYRGEISITNKGVKLYMPLRHVHDDIFLMDLHCYEEKNGVSLRIAIYLKRVLDTYFRHWPQKISAAETVPGSVSIPIYLASTSNTNTTSFSSPADINRRICIDLGKDANPYRVHSIKAVPETYWNADQKYFSIHGLRDFTCFVRFCVTSRISPRTEYEIPTEESTSLILVCRLDGSSKLRITLYAQTGLQTSLKPEGFIDPFTNIEHYGPLGDPFSLSVLRPGDTEDRRVLIQHRDYRHDYEVSVSQGTPQSALFEVMVQVNPPDGYQKDPQWALPYRSGNPPNRPRPRSGNRGNLPHVRSSYQ
jgi:hypothetical protein